eukprot:6180629-Pleurochrysis_carterae.AAC.1
MCALVVHACRPGQACKLRALHSARWHMRLAMLHLSAARGMATYYPTFWASGGQRFGTESAAGAARIPAANLPDRGRSTVAYAHEALFRTDATRHRLCVSGAAR